MVMGDRTDLKRTQALEAKRHALKLEIEALGTELGDAPWRILWLLPTKIQRKRQMRVIEAELGMLCRPYDARRSGGAGRQ
jgi:hypothetical protein